MQRNDGHPWAHQHDSMGNYLPAAHHKPTCADPSPERPWHASAARSSWLSPKQFLTTTRAMRRAVGDSNARAVASVLPTACAAPSGKLSAALGEGRVPAAVLVAPADAAGDSTDATREAAAAAAAGMMPIGDASVAVGVARAVATFRLRRDFSISGVARLALRAGALSGNPPGGTWGSGR